MTEINSQVTYVYLTVIPSERNSLCFIPIQEMSVRTLPRSSSYPLLLTHVDGFFIVVCFLFCKNLPFWFLCEFGSWFCREIFVGWLCLCNEPFKINKNRCENVRISVLTCKVTTFFTFISNRLVGRIFWNELHLLLLHVLRQLILQEMVWLSHCYNRVCGFSMFMSRTGWYRVVSGMVKDKFVCIVLSEYRDVLKVQLWRELVTVIAHGQDNSIE